VILSLNTGGEPGTVSHLGIRYPGTGDVASEMVRVKGEQVELLEQKGTTCCYAKADKFWVRDADGMPWEMYTLLADAEAETARPDAPALPWTGDEWVRGDVLLTATGSGFATPRRVHFGVEAGP
jgi:hypothetical protein